MGIRLETNTKQSSPTQNSPSKVEKLQPNKMWAMLASVFIAFLVYSVAGGLSPAARTTTAIFALAAGLWISEAVPLYLTSLIIVLLEIVLLGLPGRALGMVGSQYKVFLQPFFDPTILLFMGGFSLGAALNRHRLDARLASLILKRLPNSPGAVMAGFMAATAFLSMWMSNTATTALMLAVMVPVLQGVSAEDPWRRALVLSIPFAANLGGMGTPVGTPPNAIALGALSSAGIQVSFLQWMVLSIPIVLVLLVITWVVLLKGFKPLSKEVKVTVDADEKVSSMGKFVLGIFVLTALLWLTADWHGIPEGVVGLIPVILLFGGRALGGKDINNLGWDVLLIVGGGMSLSVAFREAGLSEVIAGLVHLDALGPWQTILLLVLFAGTLATFISHTAAASLFIPIVISLGGPLLTPAAIAAALATSVGMALPISTPPNTMAYGTKEFSSFDMAKNALPITVIGIAILSLFAVLVWNVVL